MAAQNDPSHEIEVPWTYYLATGITAMIACFLSAVQGDSGVFFRVREVLVLIFQTDVQPLWVFVPAFVIGLCACWVEKPKSSRSVLIAGLASFSLFGFAPYTKGQLAELRGLHRSMISTYSLVIHPAGKYQDEHAETLQDLNVIIRTGDFQIYQRTTMGLEGSAIQLRSPGIYLLEIDGDMQYRNAIYRIEIKDKVTELDVVLEPVGAVTGFLQRFWKAAPQGRHNA